MPGIIPPAIPGFRTAGCHSIQSRRKAPQTHGRAVRSPGAKGEPTMRRYAIRSGLSLALVLATLAAAGAAQAPPPGVTTTISFVDPPAPQYQANVGELKATFKASAGAGGTWTVSS